MLPSAKRLQHVAKPTSRAPKARVPRSPSKRPLGPPSKPPSSSHQQRPTLPPPPRYPPEPISQALPPPTQPTPPSKHPSSRALPWTLLSILGGILGFYSVQLYIASNQPCTNPAVLTLLGQKDVSARYEETADTFDSEVGVSEILMGVNRLRKALAREAGGHVLEASCGTGRNLGYFVLPGGKEKDGVKSLTFVDLSPAMVEVCRRKWMALQGGKKGNAVLVRFITGSVLDSIPPAPSSSGKYNTILQTMGLCSTPTPESLLTNLIAHLDTSDPESKILLLEHGRSYRDWLNRILDNSAEKHAEVHGCWYNRDIEALVEAAARKTGMVVTRERRRHFGTTWVFELRPGEELVRRSRDGGVGEGKEEGGDGQVEKRGDDLTWSAWLSRSLVWK